MSIARCLGWSADWRTSLTRPTLARLMEVSGLSRRCVQNWLRWLEDHGLLYCTEPGTTPQFRPAILLRGTANLAREWQLTRPAENSADETCTPPLVCSFDIAPSRAREARPEVKPKMARAPRGLPPLPRPGDAALGAVPQTRSEALAAAHVMQERARLLRILSPEHLRSIARPFFAAGWTPADLLHAIDHDTRGRQYGYSAGVRFPAGWVRSRLAAWSGPDGIPLPSRSQRLAEARRQVLAEQAARRARDAAAQARAADYPAQAARAREMLMRARRLGVVTS